MIISMGEPNRQSPKMTAMAPVGSMPPLISARPVAMMGPRNVKLVP
jgi:hypothetical protein